MFVEQVHFVLVSEMGQIFKQAQRRHQYKTLFHPTIQHSALVHTYKITKISE